MEKSQEIGQLAKALVAFQAAVGTVVFDAANPFFNSKYATLSALVEKAKPLLAAHKLAVSQLTEGEGGVTTVLMHESGEYLMSTLTLKPNKDDAQGRGSAITYARRYAYAAILGLVSDQDDDGNAAAGQQSKPAKQAPKKKASGPTPENDYDAALQLINSATTEKTLHTLLERVQDSEKFNASQKKSLESLISGRLDAITNTVTA